MTHHPSLTAREASAIVEGTYMRMRMSITARTTMMTGTILSPGACEFREEIR
jgi:hypothetical protein